MDLLDEIDQLLTQKTVDPSKVKKLLSLAENSIAFREPLMARRAIVALNERDIPTALSAAWYAVKRNPTRPEYAMLLGKVYLACREIDLALGAFESAVALQPDNFEYQFIYLQTLYLRRPSLAQSTTREIAKYVTSASLENYLAFAKHLRVPIEGGAWCEDGVVTLWMPKETPRAYAKFRVSWMDRDGWTSELVELSDDSEAGYSTLTLPLREGAELCTIKKARNGVLLHGCPLFARQADKGLKFQGVLPNPDHRSAQVIIPVYKGLRETGTCLETVLTAETDVSFRVTIVFDNPTDTKLKKLVRGFEGDPRVSIISNAENAGFTASVNRALDLNEGEDVVLLNADTVVPDRWLDRLKRAAFSAPDIGTVTPISNNGEIVSFPVAREQNQIPPGLTLAEIDCASEDANRGTYINLPTGVGFCLFIRAETLHAVGRLDSFNFGRGYGEETDFCLRARAIGWRSVCATDVFVEHVSKVSFGEEKDALARLNMKRVQKKHPEYSALMQGFLAEDPLASAFQRIERAILPKRKEKAWELVVAPDDWRTNPTLEALRYDALVTGKPTLWLYPDSRILNRVWLTSDNTFDFGRLHYDLEVDSEALAYDLTSLDLSHVHWVEPLQHDGLVDVFARMDIPQTCHVMSEKMSTYLATGGPATWQLVQACGQAIVASRYGATLAKQAGFSEIEHMELSHGAVFADRRGAGDPARRAADKGLSIAVVDGFQSSEGVAKLLDMARFAAAQGRSITFYLLANTMQDLTLSRTGKVVPLGFVGPDQYEIMLSHLKCDAVLSVDLGADPAPLALKAVAHLVEHAFCFSGAGRSELPSTLPKVTILDPTASAEELLNGMSAAFQTSEKVIACAV